MTKALAVRRSGIQGQGVFAKTNFKVGETLCYFSGKPASVATLKHIYKQGKSKFSCDALQIGIRRYLLIDKPFVYINHSCSPNAAFKNERTLVALKPIRKGEEIFYDYSATEWTPRDYIEYNHSMWPMRCKCGAAICRKLILCFGYLPARTKKKYVERGVIQNHILAKQGLPQELQRCDVCEAKLKTWLFRFLN